MSRPAQLQRQAEETERIEAEIAAAVQQPAEDEGSDPVTLPEPIGTPPVSPPVTPPTPPEDAAFWKHKFQTLEGKYRAEVPRLTTELKELKQQVTDLLATKPTVPAPQAPATQASRVTEKDAETFGADMLDVIKRQALDALSPGETALMARLEKLEAANEALHQQVTGVTKAQTVTARDRYLTALTGRVPTWATVNDDPMFHAWLGEVDGMSGVTRQDLLDNALESNDVNRTATIFEAFIKSQAPPPPVNPTPPPTPPKNDVQRQVTPGKSKTIPADVTPNERVWSYADIEQFYKDCAQGVYRHDPAEMKKIEAEIDAAVSAGRVKA